MKRTAKFVAIGVFMTQSVTLLATDEVPSPSQRIVAAVSDPTLAAVLADVLERNPGIATAVARTNAERQTAPQAKALPDPQAAVTAFILPPETRVGPQRAAISVSQRLPGGGKRKLEHQAAVHSADAHAAAAEVLRLTLITEARRLYHEIEYLDRNGGILRSERDLLGHFEELARARYASGKGFQQEVVSVQAEITRIDARLAELAERRSARVAGLNELRDRPGTTILPSTSSAPAPPADHDWRELRDRALASRPELTALAAAGRRADTRTEIAGSRSRPDFVVGVTYAWVDRRTDVDVPDNGQDIFGLTGGITIPLWGESIDAAQDEAAQRRLVIDGERRAVVSSIDRQLEELQGRLPEIRRQFELFEGILEIQSQQALRSAEAAYASGQVDALSLLDAERTLLDVRLAAARSRADLAIALADLEGAIAGPLMDKPAIAVDKPKSSNGAMAKTEQIKNRKSKIENQEYAIRNPQSVIRNPESSATEGGAL